MNPAGLTRLDRAALATACSAGFAPVGSCLKQPTRTVTIGHRSPPLSTEQTPVRRTTPDSIAAQGPCPAVAIARRQALPPDNALSGTKSKVSVFRPKPTFSRHLGHKHHVQA